jgi:hypothetical protein
MKDFLYISVTMITNFLKNENEQEEWYNKGALTKKELEE